MWFARMTSYQCCGGPVLGLSLLCLGFGILFLFLSASLLGLVLPWAGWPRASASFWHAAVVGKAGYVKR